MRSRIVITGAGLISPIGAGIDEFEKALYAGASGVAPSQVLAAMDELAPPVAEIRDFTPQQWLGNKGIRVLDRTARLLCVAAQLALSGSGIETDASSADAELGLVCGTMFGSIHSITSFDWSGLEDGPTLVNPMDFPNTVINSAAGQTAIKFKLGGINSTICCGQASGLYALDYAAEFLRLARARTLLAGGVEELSEETYLGFQKNALLSATGAARPWAAARDGAVLGEGAVLLVVESAETAQSRGRRPWAEVAGFGCAHDAHSTNAYDINAEGATAAIRMALDSAGIRPAQVACCVAGASGSRAGDAVEARALLNVLGQRFAAIPICAPKAALGESLGAAGATAALIAALALQKQCLPPTVGIPEQGAEGIRLLPQPQTIHGDYALVNAFGCDGNNAALVLRQWKE